MISLHATPFKRFKTFKTFKTLLEDSISDGWNCLNDLNGLNPYLGRGAFSQIDFDHLRIFRDARRRTLGNLLPCAQDYDAL